jgi:hypothetical protein
MSGVNFFNSIEFAVASAEEAFDQRGAYADPIGSYFDNVVDTLNEKGITGNEYHQAIDKYRDTIARLFTEQIQFGNLFDALSHAGVHEIEPANGDDGSIVIVSHNGVYFGTIGQCCGNSDTWVFTINGILNKGNGLNSLIDTSKEKRKY